MREEPIDWITGEPQLLRRWRETRPEVLAPILPPDVTISLLPAEGACQGGLVFHPTTQAAPAPIVYFHGGSFITGSPETHRVHCAWIAHLTGSTVYSIRYRLAPEHPLPAQAEDARAAIRRQLDRHETLRLMGDSAGGLVTLWGHAALTEAERRAIRDITLFYPAAGLPLPPSPQDAEHEKDGLGPRAIESMYRRLDPQGLLRGNPLYDPFATGFPPPSRLTMLAAGEDPILRDALALSTHFSARLLIAEDEEHSFLAQLPQPKIMESLVLALDPTQ